LGLYESSEKILVGPHIGSSGGLVGLDHFGCKLTGGRAVYLYLILKQAFGLQALERGEKTLWSRLAGSGT
jgi:hypothetical protein